MVVAMFVVTASAYASSIGSPTQNFDFQGHTRFLTPVSKHRPLVMNSACFLQIPRLERFGPDRLY
jgi:hypothetical protein